MTIRKILGVFIASLLFFGTVGCVNSAYSRINVDTLNKGIAVANTELRGANLLFQNLIKDKVITDKAEAQKILGDFKNAASNLSLATEAVNAGNLTEGQDSLEKATGTIDILIALLSPHVKAEEPQ